MEARIDPLITMTSMDAAEDTFDPIDEVDQLSAQLRGHLERLTKHRLRHVPAAPVSAKPQPVTTVPLVAVPMPAPTPTVALVAETVVHVVAIPVAPRSPGAGAVKLTVVREELGDCRRCKLHATRKNIVFGVGSADADLVFVGEGPGANEDIQCEPFVGEAGQLLTKMIEAMGWSRQTVYIANIIKCRPPGNRNPEADEIEACEPFLKSQLAALRPRIIVALGKFAAQWLTGKADAPISSLRGKFHVYEGIQVMPTYHPAYLLRTPGQKRTVWGDLQLVMQELERLGIKPPNKESPTS